MTYTQFKQSVQLLTPHADFEAYKSKLKKVDPQYYHDFIVALEYGWHIERCAEFAEYVFELSCKTVLGTRQFIEIAFSLSKLYTTDFKIIDLYKSIPLDYFVPLYENGIQSSRAGEELSKFIKQMTHLPYNFNPVHVGFDKAIENLASQQFKIKDFSLMFGIENARMAFIVISNYYKYNHFPCKTVNDVASLAGEEYSTATIIDAKCFTCINYSKTDGCVCAEECNNFDQFVNASDVEKLTNAWDSFGATPAESEKAIAALRKKKKTKNKGVTLEFKSNMEPPKNYNGKID